MGGSGYNVSLAAGRAVRRQASSRTSVWFWLEGPFYVYDMGCGPDDNPHEFRSRTPLITSDEDPDGVVVWCGLCIMFRFVQGLEAHPILNEASGLPPEDLFRDKRGHIKGKAIEQDDNILRERVARKLMGRGLATTDEDLSHLAVEFGLPVAEIKRINAGLSSSDSRSADQVELCRARLHEMTLDNVLVKSGRRTCKICYREKDRAATAARRAKAAA